MSDLFAALEQDAEGEAGAGGRGPGRAGTPGYGE